MVKKVLLGIVVLIVVLIGAAAAYVASRQNLKFDNVAYPPVEASTDSAVVARGHYIARVISPCSACHGDPAQVDSNMAGQEVPLSGGFVFDIPPGKFYTRNLTPDDETGLGKVPANAIARAIRYGVGHDGRALLPFMEVQNLSDEDLVAVVSYLKSMPPVHNMVPAHQYNTLGKVLKATLMANPVGPRETPPQTSPRGATVENGRYLVESVALCGSCHTQRDLQTGQFTGAHLAGATGFTDELDHSRTWSPPNLTSDPTTGRLAQMTEDEFVTRFRTGRLLPGSPMPWQSFMKMNEEDLRAIYKYLKTLPPVVNDVGPPVVQTKS